MSNPNDHSQCGESSWILENLKPEPGFFMEVGAFDGIQSSNTYLFEQLGWTGYLIEADPFLAARSQSNRRSPTLCCAVGYPGSINPFFINEMDRGLSGLDRKEGKIIPVPVLSLDFICVHQGIKKLDLLSIDTEGSEVGVWTSLSQFKPKIVIIEYNTSGRQSQEQEIRTLFDIDGYKLVHKTLYNLIFVFDETRLGSKG